MELVVTMLLLSLFASLAFPLYWSANKAAAEQGMSNAAQAATLTLVTLLPSLTEEVRPPYWIGQDRLIEGSTSEWRVAYYRGDKDSLLVLRTEGESRLRLTAGGDAIVIDNLCGLRVDWWKKGERTIGFTVSWRRGAETQEFHAAFGGLPL
jgi:hypothetical protein